MGASALADREGPDEPGELAYDGDVGLAGPHARCARVQADLPG